MSTFDFIAGPKPSYGKSVAVIGCGPTALYFLNHVVNNRSRGLNITFFSASNSLGAGMPYDTRWVGEETLANIACEEVPHLPIAPDDWFQAQSDSWLAGYGIDRRAIGPSFIPARHVLGKYFEAQFQLLLARAARARISVRCLNHATVTDLLPTELGVTVAFRRDGFDKDEILEFDCAAMATGHQWPGEDTSGPAFLSSPWPVSRLEVTQAKHIGLIGTSLSAVDTCLTLAKRNGFFARDFDGRLTYISNDDASDFKVVMHSRRGLLPTLRIHFEYPQFDMYSYISETELRGHIRENDGYLSLDFLFEHVLKTVLKEKSPDVHTIIAPMDLETFSGFLQARRRTAEPFELMRDEYAISVALLRERTPVVWREALDDIAYTLNFHTRYLNANDRMRLRDHLMPLVTYLVAVLPQVSCEQILAMHAAERLSVVAIGDDMKMLNGSGDDRASIVFHDTHTGQEISLSYDLIVDCRGQASVGIEDFPFQTLVEQGIVTAAKIQLGTPPTDGEVMLGGVSVDEHFHPLSSNGMPTRSIFILAAPALKGIYPYHSGLPFCNEVAKVAALELMANTGLLTEKLAAVG